MSSTDGKERVLSCEATDRPRGLGSELQGDFPEALMEHRRKYKRRSRHERKLNKKAKAIEELKNENLVAKGFEVGGEAMEGIEQTSESQNATSTQPNHKPRTRGAEAKERRKLKKAMRRVENSQKHATGANQTPLAESRDEGVKSTERKDANHEPFKQQQLVNQPLTQIETEMRQLKQELQRMRRLKQKLERGEHFKGEVDDLGTMGQQELHNGQNADSGEIEEQKAKRRFRLQERDKQKLVREAQCKRDREECEERKLEKQAAAVKVATAVHDLQQLSLWGRGNV